jgi:hypothetical protein
VHNNGLSDNVYVVEEVDADNARAQVRDHRCVAGEHCAMKMTPLTEDNLHMCLNCDKKLHGALCGTLWDERGDNFPLSVEDLSPSGQNKSKNRSALICKHCCMPV